MQVWMRWIWPGLFTTALITALAIWSTRDAIETDLSERFQQAAQSEQLTWPQIELEGRDAIISGEAPDQTELDRINDLAAGIAEIRIVQNHSSLAPEQQDYALSLEKSGDEITLKGYYPYEMRDGALADQLAEVLPAEAMLKDETVLARGAPDMFLDRALYAASLLDQLADGEVTVNGDALSVSGKAAGHDVYGVLRTLDENNLPFGLTLSDLEVTPATAEPFTFSAARQGGEITINGFVPNESVRAELLGQLESVFPSENRLGELKIAAGAPENFSAFARFALDQLVQMNSGEVSVNGAEISVLGDAADRQSYGNLSHALDGELPDGLTVAQAAITPPIAENYSWSVTKEAGRIALSGSVPSEAARKDMIGKAQVLSDGAVLADELFIERGAPEGFAKMTDDAFELIESLSEGSILFNEGEGVTVAGETVNSASYQALVTVFGQSSDGGLAVDIGGVKPPPAAPYITTLSKTEDALTLSGNVPDIETRDALLERVAEGSGGLTVVDDTSFASGAPENLPDTVDVALEALGLLEAGEVSIAPEGLAIDGSLADAAASERFDAFLERQGLQNLTNQVEPVVRAPYTWSATRDGAKVTFNGSVPSDAVQQALIGSIGDAIADAELSDGMDIQEDAPPGFAEEAGRVTALLGRMSKGSAQFADGQFSLSGTAETPLDFDAIVDEVAKSPSIEATVTPSAATGDYLLSATRRDDAVSLSGSVPSVAVRDEIETMLRQAFPDANVETQIVVESGAPDGFIAQAREVVKRLTDLKNGEVSLLNGKLAISGAADTPEAYEELSAVLEEGGEGVEGSIEPATVSPYTWSVERRDKGSRLSGFVPDTMAGRANEAAAKSVLGGEVEEKQRVAAGEPDDFANAVAALIGAAGQLEDSAASLSDKDAEIEGRASSQERAERIGNRLEEDLDGLGYSLRRELTFPTPRPAATTQPETQSEGGAQSETAQAPSTAEAPVMDKADEVAASQQQQQAAPAAVEMTTQASRTCQADLDGIMSEGDIRFATSKAVIKQASFPLLDRLAAALKECGAVKLEIGGHTDSRGTVRYNRGLSEARATSVRKYLASLGVDTSLISVKGYGDSEPRATNDTPMGRSANRRIEFKLTQ